MSLIAQVGDLHLMPAGQAARLGVDPAVFLSLAVERLNALRPRPDVVIVTGDLVHEASSETYRRLHRIIEPLEIPLYLMAGNHDELRLLREEFRDHSYLFSDPEFAHYELELERYRIVALDTTIPGDHSGLLCDQRLGWIERTLAAKPHLPTMIAMHHPPFSTGIRGIDKYGLSGSQELASLVEESGRVKRVICGHVHRPILCTWAGTVAGSAPALSAQFGLDLDDGSDRVQLVDEPHAILLHDWREPNTIVTHTLYIQPNAE